MALIFYSGNNKKITLMKDTSQITLRQVLSWDKRAEVQWSQKAMLESFYKKKIYT